ncbi:putative glycosyltransferase [Tieghemostelium lacteum]|uniref:Putative glycosyltransferase n=1 Tax=Tieghemostelium lacteum TaxID=361077 RepID=A0A152A1R4_TIELA|nr:putative glycosyltransferase [Tieghemostelium lacteum]|eukprot:KYR00192.1 putative glycosyltransferase [Tieghemostelium lacteum]
MKYDFVYTILIIFHLIFFLNLLTISRLDYKSPSQQHQPPPIQIQNTRPSKYDIDPQSQELNKIPILDSKDENRDKKDDRNTVVSSIDSNSKYLYLTFTNNDKYIKGIKVLKQSLIESNTHIDLMVMVTKEVSSELAKDLEMMGCIINLIEMVEIPNGITIQLDRWRPAFTKFKAWELVQYEKVIWLDSDMLVMKNLDHLFNSINILEHPEHIYAAVDADANSCEYKPERLKLINSGILVLSPNMKMFNTLLDNIVETSKIQKTVNDQDVINFTIPHWNGLNYPEYGAQVTHCECQDKRLWNLESTYFIHYTAGLKDLPKPWDFHPDFFRPDNYCIRQLYDLWSSFYLRAEDTIEQNKKLIN